MRCPQKLQNNSHTSTNVERFSPVLFGRCVWPSIPQLNRLGQTLTCPTKRYYYIWIYIYTPYIYIFISRYRHIHIYIILYIWKKLLSAFSASIWYIHFLVVIVVAQNLNSHDWCRKPPSPGWHVRRPKCKFQREEQKTQLWAGRRHGNHR